MVFGIFASSESKRLKRSQALLKGARQAHEIKRLQFRKNLYDKLTFMYPSIKIVMNTQSPFFLGYRQEGHVFVTGRFDDSRLPSIYDLEQNIEASTFERDVNEFISSMQAYKMRNPCARMMRSSTIGEGYCFEETLYPCEVRLVKNGKAIARSGIFSPKHKGYFDEEIYKHVVEDTNGGPHGISKVSLSVLITNHGETCRDEVTLNYHDNPRKSVSQNTDHYVEVCSMFTPFLREIETSITDSKMREMLWYPSDEDLDDTKIGLPRNNKIKVDWV